MPMAIPLIGAVASVGMGIAAGATTLVGGLMIAGGALTAIGSLTGNQSLSKFGGLLSLGGGITGLATGAFSTAASAVTESSTAAAPLSQTAEAAGGSLGAEAGAAGSTATEAGSASGALGQTASLEGANAGLGSSGADLSGSLGGTAGGAVPVASPMQPMIDTASTVPTPGFGPDAASTGSDAHLYGDPAVSNGSGPGVGLIQTNSPSVMDRLKDASTWAKNNKEIVNAGAGIIGGGMKALGDQEAIKTRIKLEEDAAQRQRQRYSDSVRNLQAPVYQAPTKG